MKTKAINDFCPMTPKILDLLFDGQMDEAGFTGTVESYLEHLRTCRTCQAALEMFGDFNQAWSLEPSLLGQNHSAAGAIPDAERLVAYADLVGTGHEEAAKLNFADTAEHLATCAICRERLREEQAILAHAAPAPADTRPSDDAAAEEPPQDLAIWQEAEYLGDRARRSVGWHTISLSPREITVRGRLVNYLPPGGLPYAPLLEAGQRAGAMRGGPVAPTVATLIVDLQTLDTVRVPWIRVVLDLARQPSGSLACVLQAQWIAFAGDPSPVDAAGLAWRLERPGGTTPIILEHGITNDLGMALWSSAEAGALLLIVESDAGEWVFPLELTFTA